MLIIGCCLLAVAVLAAFNNPAVKEGLEKQGNIIKVSTADEAHGVIVRDVAKYAAVAKKVNLTP